MNSDLSYLLKKAEIKKLNNMDHMKEDTDYIGLALDNLLENDITLKDKLEGSAKWIDAITSDFPEMPMARADRWESVCFHKAEQVYYSFLVSANSAQTAKLAREYSLLAGQFATFIFTNSPLDKPADPIHDIDVLDFTGLMGIEFIFNNIKQLHEEWADAFSLRDVKKMNEISTAMSVFTFERRKNGGVS